MQHANLLPILNDMFNEFRGPEFRQHIRYITTELRNECPSDTAIELLPEIAKRHVVPVGEFFNTLGVLVANKVISDLLVASYVGRSVLRTWYYLEPYIRKERQRRRDENWFMFFEHLAFMVRQHGQSKIRDELKLKKMSTSETIPEDLHDAKA